MLDRVIRTLEAVPGVHVTNSYITNAQSAEVGYACDARIELDVKGQLTDLHLAIRKAGYPRDVREAIWKLAPLKQQGIHPIFVAPTVSPGARELLRAEGLSYADSGGSLCLQLPWVYLYVDHPAPPSESRKARTLFRGNRAQVLHLLLAEPQRAWHVKDMAQSAQVGLSTAHEVFRTLEDEGYVERQGRGPEVTRRVVEPGRLLDAWAEAHTLREYKAYGYYAWTQSLPRLRSRICLTMEEIGITYALTLASGAELTAPFMTQVETLSILVPNETPLDSLTERLDLKPVDAGANINILVTAGRAPLLCRRQIESVWVASDIQLYLDLNALPARGKEQAQHLRRERLSF